jgi:hypothetical protein
MTKKPPKPRKGQPKRDDPAQSKRFIEAAKELGQRPDPKAFENAFDRIARSYPRKGRD